MFGSKGRALGACAHKRPVGPHGLPGVTCVVLFGLVVSQASGIAPGLVHLDSYCPDGIVNLS